MYVSIFGIILYSDIRPARRKIATTTTTTARCRDTLFMPWGPTLCFHCSDPAALQQAKRLANLVSHQPAQAVSEISFPHSRDPLCSPLNGGTARRPTQRVCVASRCLPAKSNAFTPCRGLGGLRFRALQMLESMKSGGHHNARTWAAYPRIGTAGIDECSRLCQTLISHRCVYISLR